MNKILSILLAVVISTAFLACSDDDSSSSGVPTPPTGGTTGMTAKVNGASWTAFEGGVTAIVDSTGELFILAVGAAGTDTSIVSIFTESPQIGTYTFDTLGNASNGASVDLFFGAVSGGVAITAHNTSSKTVTGTFNFVTGEFFGTTGPVITEGVFNNIEYVD